LNHSAALTSILSVLFNPTTTVVFGSYILNIVDLLDSIQTYKCNIISGLPKIINNILNHPKRKDYDLSSLFCIVSAGQNVTSELIELVRKELANAKIMLVAYGSTETNNAFTNMINLDSFNPDSYQTCVGRPGAHVEAKIVNPETGKFQPFGEEGELYFRSYSQTRGYWNDEEKTNLAFDKDGWYNTGDFLSMDAGI
jgi:fatty-acyl-CoA synthase